MKDELRIRNVRKSHLSCFAFMPLAIIISDLEYWGFELTLAGLDSYLLMSLSYAVGWFIAAFLPEKKLSLCFRIVVVLMAATLCGVLFLPQSYAFLFCMLLFHLASAICTALGFFVFAFKLNNAERLFGMMIIAAYYGIVGLTWFMGNMDFVYKYLVAGVLMVLLIVCAFRMDGDSVRLPKKEGEVRKNGEYMVFFLFVIFFVLEALYSNYYGLWTEEMFTYYGIASIAAVPLVYLICVKFRAGIWHSWNLYFLFPIIGMGLFVFADQAFFSTGAFCCGLGSNIGYVVVMYVIGGFGKRRSTYNFFRIYCLIAFLMEMLSSLAFSSLYDLFSDYFGIIALGFLAAMLLLNFALSPLLFRQFFDTDWATEYKSLDMSEPATKMVRADKLWELQLSHREKEVAALLLQGLTARQIAVEIGIAESTVNGYCGTLYKKLGINSRMELFVRFGIVEDN